MAFFSTPKLRLLATAAPLGLIALTAMPAAAQVATNPSSTPPTKPAVDEQGQDASESGQATDDVVVTGTLFRTNKETPSPVTTITADDLDKRGINTVQDAVQRLSANGSGALPNSFSANGAFASGASAASLRGLTTSSTLVLFDGLRAAYYPLADDGTRNFVDLNSIPAAIVERIDVLKDGASSTYGADAVAGVVNIITKKEVKGLYLTGSAGISEKGDLGEQRVSALYGYGDLDDQGFNVYVSGEYQINHALYNRDRGYPYNTSDLSKLCGTSVGTPTIPAGTTTCRTNSIVNGTQFDGTYAALGTTLAPIVRAYNATNTAAVGARYQLLNGCGNLPGVSLTPTQYSAGAGLTAPINNCTQDSRNLFGVIAPEQERIGGSIRGTLRLGGVEAYGMFNYYRSDVFYTGAPQAIRAASPAGGTLLNGTLPTTASIALPVYVCARNNQNATLVNNIPTFPTACTAANGTLNPNNPFAAQGQTARILYQLSDIPVSNERLVQTYRGAVGFKGTIGPVSWNVEGVGMQEDLKATYKGYIYIQNLLNVIADGSYNFVNPQNNSQATRDYLAPTLVNTSRSKLYQVQGNLSASLFDLPGGPLQVAVGAAYRYEAVIAPSANPAVPGQPLASYFTINRFGTSGARRVYSGFFEIDAPIVSELEVNVSGRYDHYSSGQSNFSPKVGAKFTPIKQLAIRGTFSKGFRIPSFAESFGLPTTGFITQTPPPSYSSRCTVAAGNYCTAQYSLGLTSIGNPNLRPEKATNFTAGVIIEPIKNVSLSIDYYNIYKKDLITGADYSPQIAAYYANGSTTALTAGVTGVTVDTVGFATLPAGAAPFPLLSTIQYGFINADSAKSTGIDFDLETRVNISSGLTWTSSLDANYVIELSQTVNGVKQSYQDSLGAYQITAASGTPRLRGSWANTFDFGKFALTATAYYTKGYSLGAADDGNTLDGQYCGTNNGSFGSFAVYRDGATIVRCRTNDFIYVDLTATVRVNEHFTLYGNMLNALGAKPPYDPSTYGASNYNPAWANSGIVGRYFRVGARAKF